MIEDFGARVASVWEGMRSTTRSLIVGALQSSNAGAAGVASTTRKSNPYDARADWELSRLLAALDERATEEGASLNAEQARELRRMAETCAVVLQHQTQSAEVFAQLVERAFGRRDYARIDTLADALAARFAPSEVCELARNPHVVVRALAQESAHGGDAGTILCPGVAIRRHGMEKRTAVARPPPDDGIEGKPALRTNGLADGQEAFVEDVVDFLCRCHVHLAGARECAAGERAGQCTRTVVAPRRPIQ